MSSSPQGMTVIGAGVGMVGGAARAGFKKGDAVTVYPGTPFQIMLDQSIAIN